MCGKNISPPPLKGALPKPTFRYPGFKTLTQVGPLSGTQFREIRAPTLAPSGNLIPHSGMIPRHFWTRFPGSNLPNDVCSSFPNHRLSKIPEPDIPTGYLHLETKIPVAV